MKDKELKWTEILIILLVIIVGISAFSFYYAGMIIGYNLTPLLVMQMVVIMTQLVILSVIYKIHLTIQTYIKRLKK